MKSTIMALGLLGVSLPSMAEQAPSLSIEKELLPLIIGTPFLHEHEGKEYLCGQAVHHPNAAHREVGRFVFLFETGTDWKIYEPSRDENETVWTAWDETYTEVCEE